MSKARMTTDHDEIMQWVELRGGNPARVKRTARAGGLGTGRRRGADAGLLRIDYPGFSGTESLEQISWKAWFDTFDRAELAFLHQDEIAGGKTSRFSKLVSRDAVTTEPSGARGGRRPGTSARGARAASGRKGAEARASGSRRVAAKKKVVEAGAGATAERGTAAPRTTSKHRSKAGGTTARARGRSAAGRAKSGRAEAADPKPNAGASRKGATRASTSKRASARHFT